MKISICIAAAVVLMAGSVTAGENKPALNVGDRAPALAGQKWVKGEPVAAFEKGKVYVVEFWATWCPPCRASIPHLSELQAKFKDKGVIVIGQNCWERDASKVAPFITKMGDKMNYRVALDTDSGAMAKSWMAAAGQDGIPTAFVVDKAGKIAWIGHPMDGLDEAVAKAAGTSK